MPKRDKQKEKPKQITTKSTIKKEQAVELWRETHGHITNICRAINVTRKTFYEWMKDEKFALRLIDAEQELNDDIRDVLISKAADGDMTAVIFYLKSRHPDFKQERTTNVAVQVNNYQDTTSKQKDKYGIR